ncbi:MAG: alpha-amylase family protein [Bilifractor sp.]
MSDLYKKTNRCYLIDHHSPQPPIVPLGNMHIEEYEQFFREANIDSLMVYCKDHWGNTYYDSKVEGAQKHKGVKGDWIRTVRDATEKMGIEFVAYYCIEYDEGAARRFPQWRVRKADGTPLIRDDIYAKWSLNCYNTGYREYALAQLEEIVTNYHPDALFLDIFGASLCYCDTCRGKFKKAFGYELPETQDGLLKHQKDVKQFLDDKAEGFYRELRDRLKAIDPTLGITINFACHYPESLRKLLDYQYSEPLMLDNWFSSAYARDVAVGQYPMLAPGEASQVYNYDDPQKYVVDLCSIGAQGCRVGMYSGSQHIDGTLDHEEAKRLGTAYHELKMMEPWLSQKRRPVRSIGILQSDLSKKIPDEEFLPDAILRMKKRSPHITAILGAMMCAEAAKVPYCVIPEDTFVREDLSAYDCILLPEVYVVSDAVQKKLADYVQEGGKVIVSGKTGQYNQEFGYSSEMLQQLLGIQYVKTHDEYKQNDWSAYLAVDDKKAFQGLLSVTTPPVSDFFVENTCTTAKRLAHFMKPAVACSPTEWINWWSPPAGEETEIPAVTCNSFGKGLALNLAYDYFTMASTGKYRDSYAFFEDLLRILKVAPVMKNETAQKTILRTAFFETEKTYQIHQISTIAGKYNGEAVPVEGGLLRTSIPVRSAAVVYPEKRELSVEKDGTDYVIRLPELSVQQLIVLEKAVY